MLALPFLPRIIRGMVAPSAISCGPNSLYTGPGVYIHMCVCVCMSVAVIVAPSHPLQGATQSLGGGGGGRAMWGYASE